MVFRPGDKITVAAGEQGARLIILGGATLSGRRHIWRNSSPRQRNLSRRPRRNGGPRIGTGDVSIFRSMIATSIYLFQTNDSSAIASSNFPSD